MSRRGHTECPDDGVRGRLDRVQLRCAHADHVSACDMCVEREWGVAFLTQETTFCL